MLFTSLIYIFFVLSVSKYNVTGVLVFVAYPIFLTVAMGNVLKVKASDIVPLFFIAIFAFGNVLMDRSVVGHIGLIPFSAGMISAAVIIMKGILCIWILFIIRKNVSFYQLCIWFRRLGFPDVFVVQMLLLERYSKLLIHEGIALKRARDSRSFGTNGMGIGIAVKMLGVLFIRSVSRAENIYRCMVLRGFEGNLQVRRVVPLNRTDYGIVSILVLIFFFLRVFF
jgi:cobalt/nickel transport system permease protein